MAQLFLPPFSSTWKFSVSSTVRTCPVVPGRQRAVTRSVFLIARNAPEEKGFIPGACHGSALPTHCEQQNHVHQVQRPKQPFLHSSPQRCEGVCVCVFDRKHRVSGPRCCKHFPSCLVQGFRCFSENLEARKS